MSQTDTSCLPVASENVKTCAAQAWTEVHRVAESLPKPMRSTLARFFPTDACAAPIRAAISELVAQPAIAPPNSSDHKIGGFVFFPGKSLVGQTLTILIPLHITGETYVDGLVLDVGHYYYIPHKCDVEVSEGAKLVALIIDFN